MVGTFVAPSDDRVGPTPQTRWWLKPCRRLGSGAWGRNLGRPNLRVTAEPRTDDEDTQFQPEDSEDRAHLGSATDWIVCA